MMAIGCAGCSAWTPSEPHDQSLLKPVDLADDGVQLEVISFRLPFGAEEINGGMWDAIDEQQFPSEVRQHLTENGIRAGLVDRQLPSALARMAADAEKRPTKITEAAAQLEQVSPVSRQIMQLHSGWHGEIISSSVYPELPLLIPDDGQLCGRTYPAAQGMLQTKAESVGDRRVRLHMVPELEYGQVRQQWLSEDGRMLPQQGKPKRIFDNLAFDATLSAGQMLVLTCRPNRGGTLGHYLFTDPLGDQLQQKVFVVRLAQSRYDDLFSKAVATDAASSNSGKTSEQRDDNSTVAK
jgi:hypothetical protein